MDHPSPAERRSAYRRVGGAAGAVFLVFLMIGIARGPAQAAPIVPAATSTPAPSGAQPGYRHHERGRFGGGGEQTVPGDPGFAPGDQGSLPGDQGSLPGDQGSLPGDQGSLPGDPGFGPGQGGGQDQPPTAPSDGGSQS